MRRGSFTILCALSLLTWVGSIALTIRSYCTNDNFHHSRITLAAFTHRNLSISTSCGLIEFFRGRFIDQTRQRTRPEESYWLRYNTITPYSHRMGEGAYFHVPGYWSGNIDDGDFICEHWRIRIPMWMITLSSMVLPIVWICTKWRARRLAVQRGFSFRSVGQPVISH